MKDNEYYAYLKTRTVLNIQQNRWYNNEYWENYLDSIGVLQKVQKSMVGGETFLNT